MKNLAYSLLKFWIKFGLYLYYGRIKIFGLENIPKNEPVLFLPNHQGALMDVLLIVTDCRRKPYFLTRSDVFGKPALIKFFTFLRMLPIYRMRDGRNALFKNQAVFDRCAQLFRENRAVVMFPEANHDRRRRVRPLSKGFTRILFYAMKKPGPENAAGQAIHIVPVGMNYVSNDGFPDRVALYYGESIIANDFYDPSDGNTAAAELKKAVSGRLKTLTTHIGDGLDYENNIQQLDALQADYLNPVQTNSSIEDLRLRRMMSEKTGFKKDELQQLEASRWETKIRQEPAGEPNLAGEPNGMGNKTDKLGQIKAHSTGTETSQNSANTKPRPSFLHKISRGMFKAIFWTLNFPVIAVWKVWVKPKVWEPEFTATLRFGFALLVYPIYYVALFATLAMVWTTALAASVAIGIFLFNWIYVRRSG